MKATLDEVMDAQDNLPEMAAILAPGVRVRGDTTALIHAYNIASAALLERMGWTSDEFIFALCDLLDARREAQEKLEALEMKVSIHNGRKLSYDVITENGSKHCKNDAELIQYAKECVGK